MKKKLAVIVATLMILGLLSGTAFADLPGGGWVTNVQVQNVSANSADISIASYGAGGPFNSATKNAATGASVTFLNTELGIPSGFRGAGVIQSTESVFAILFATNYQSGTANTASAIARGIGQDNVANSLSFPLVKKKWAPGRRQPPSISRMRARQQPMRLPRCRFWLAVLGAVPTTRAPTRFSHPSRLTSIRRIWGAPTAPWAV